MPKPDDSALHFPCPRCFTRLKAPLPQAGTKRRCPRCQRVFEVPATSRGMEPQEGYALGEGMDASPVADRPYIAVDCAVCSTRMYATEDQVGEEVVCPDCDTPAVVPPPVKLEEESQKGPPAGPVEEYAFYDEADESACPFGWRPEEQTYIAVACPVCDTLMKVPQDQVGQEIVCPDCDEPLVVPPAETPAKRRGPADVTVGEVGEYAVREEADQPAAGPSYIAVVCPLCATRLHATEDQVGREIVCPDCDELLVVPPPAPKPKAGPRLEAGEEYRVEDSAERPDYEPAIVRTPWQVRRGAAAADAVSGSGSSRKPPRWPFLSGIFNFPLYGTSRPRWFLLSAGACVALFFGQIAFKFSTSEGPSVVATAGLWIMGVAFTGIAFVCGVMCIVATFVHCLTIVQETAAGNDAIESWPDALFLDWMPECFFVVNSLALSGLPGLGVARLLGYTDESIWLFITVSTLVFFPIVQLSMLEANSRLSPLSLPVCRSLLGAWWAWGLFYVETTVLMVAADWLATQAWQFVPLLGTVIAAAILVAALMIYFRLLGRLAWCCTQALARAGRETDESPTNDQEDGDG